MMQKKYALYCRVSTDKQTNENQKIRLEELAKSRGWDYDVFEEIESSRKTRPVKQELLAKLRAGDYAGIVVFKLDRFARSFTELILDVTNLIDRGVEFISVSDAIDFSSSTGKLHFHILSAFANFERELIRERTLEGLRRTKLQGTQLGRPMGSRDKKKRRKSGYILRQAYQHQRKDKLDGIYKPVEDYIDKVGKENPI